MITKSLSLEDLGGERSFDRGLAAAEIDVAGDFVGGGRVDLDLPV